MSYRALKDSIDKIAVNCGRDPKEIHLVAVTKGHPWEEIKPLYDEGCRHFAESRLQEAETKLPQAPTDIHWHFIGSLQKNKVRKVIDSFYLIHSVDTVELAQRISSCSEEEGIVTTIFLESNTSGEGSKHGLTPQEWLRQFDKIKQLPGIKIKGLMTMAPLVEEEQIVRTCFSHLRQLRDALQQKDPNITELSMGMSRDYLLAIQEGATHLRIGTALFHEKGNL